MLTHNLLRSGLRWMNSSWSRHRVPRARCVTPAEENAFHDEVRESVDLGAARLRVSEAKKQVAAS